MVEKAEALAVARKRIVTLQAQMTGRILGMAAEVEKLLEVVDEREARQFLRVSCNLPQSELSTYVRFSRTLKDHADTLKLGRVSFPVVKSLVAAPSDAREEIVERMSLGARIDTNEIAAIRRRLRDAKLTPGQVLAARTARNIASSARKQADRSAGLFRSKVDVLYRKLLGTVPKFLHEVAASETVRMQAGELRDQFSAVFGDRNDDATPGASRRLPILDDAYHALCRVADGRFGDRSLYPKDDPGPSSDGGLVRSLGRLAGWPDHIARWNGRGQSLSELPPHQVRPRAIELCAGAGGMATGLERAGFKHVALIEYDKHAAATLRHNRPDWNVMQEDIRKIDFRRYRKDRIALVCGGLPCQPYSSDGYGLGKDDPRDLLLEGVRVVKEVRPAAFMFENVPGLLQEHHAEHLANVLSGFKRAGYEAEIHRLEAEDFGIAQERTRILIIGLRKDLAGSLRMPPRFPERRIDIGSALVDLMAAKGWTGAADWALARREQPIRDRNGTIIGRGALASTIVTRRGVPRQKEAARWGAKAIDIAGLPREAPTPEEAAAPDFKPGLTARMRARLQNFDDDWHFCGGTQAVADQIGNAVPPRLAQAAGLALFAAIQNVAFDWEALLWPESPRMHLQPPPMEPEIGLVCDREHMAS